ncbi:hypothetical protein PHYSODRAFT_322769 [Phytophthora sojae]|uniref:Uncharacterized protein n=1 Tax=Phytophthora sojae (strain P6497) TaxID=1094619 RepID=G4YKS2_PHYSP|nr:hypothetical protein PHYSODRAFT_322769 [Phytophthora sojae]EGZ29226.1 hypothetical protein PHYSODRAFT_322769 [Phytophthora sojae]|eukprot:XP_009516501.1 hypothetical protein PHYSODRAFT_322769 [Phytophthora sojae]
MPWWMKATRAAFLSGNRKRHLHVVGVQPALCEGVLQGAGVRSPTLPRSLSAVEGAARPSMQVSTADASRPQLLRPHFVANSARFPLCGIVRSEQRREAEHQATSSRKRIADQLGFDRMPEPRRIAMHKVSCMARRKRRQPRALTRS